MPEHRDRELLRQTFGTVAEQYDRARPTYPAEVFDGIAELAALAPGSRVLEIGPGTGKATIELVRRGYAVTGVELSAELAEFARKNVPAAEIEVANFEEWEPVDAGFDAITAFAAFHWISPELRFTKPVRLLRPGGALAVVHGHHVLPDDGDRFFAEVQEDYDAVVPHPDNGPPEHPDEVGSEWADDFRASGVFDRVEERRYLQPLTYSANGFVALSGTFSVNIALPAQQRDELFRRIHTRIEARGGTVTKHYLQMLTVGYRPR
jgi:SAM-dependent methyltransferase